MKKILFLFILLLPSISFADWWYAPSCGSTIEATCLESIKTCHTQDIFTNITQKANIDFYSVNPYTPSSMEVTADMYSISGQVQYYNQHMLCSWVGAACTADAPYDPVTDACVTPSPNIPPVTPIVKMYGDPDDCLSGVGSN